MKNEALDSRITVEISAALRRDLEQVAAAEDRPLAYVARRAIARDVAQRNRGGSEQAA